MSALGTADEQLLAVWAFVKSVARHGKSFKHTYPILSTKDTQLRLGSSPKRCKVVFPISALVTLAWYFSEDKYQHHQEFHKKSKFLGPYLRSTDSGGMSNLLV